MKFSKSSLYLFVFALNFCWPTAIPAKSSAKPNVIVVLADQWRYEAFGYAGNTDVKTPNIDRLHSESVHFVNAVSGMPVCSPMRASFLTGQRPLTHGVFLNDVQLNTNANTIGKIFSAAGYVTGYIGKWHIDGNGRSSFIPSDRRQGFDYWKVLECTHDYNNSSYFADEPKQLKWDGYDSVAQTQDAQQYLRDHAKSDKPFLLVLAWGPPHDPYQTAPEKYRGMYEVEKLTIRPNVPGGLQDSVRQILAGYYAHCTALDDCMGELRRTLAETGLAKNTILVFSADHGDMIGSQGLFKKQKPFDESIRVPMLVHWPKGLGKKARALEEPMNSEDIMPTLSGLCKIPVPKSAEGLDYSGYIRGGRSPNDGATIILCAAPFGEWERRNGGKEYRGVRTKRYTYVRDLNGPWLLFDNQTDSFQTNNLVGQIGSAKLQKELGELVQRKLRERHDEFKPAEFYVRRWGYRPDANGTIPYKP